MMTQREAVAFSLRLHELDEQRHAELEAMLERSPRDPTFPNSLCTGDNPPVNMIVPAPDIARILRGASCSGPTR
jgi:hypothetical protein